MRDGVVSGEAVRELRLAALLSQAELAALSDLSESFIRGVERGRYQPGDVSARKLARGLRCSVQDFSTPKRECGSGAAA